MAEEGWTNNEIAYLTVKEYLKDFNTDLDALILGCTHFPLFEDIIAKCMPNVKIINTGKVIANELKEKNNKNAINTEENKKVAIDDFYLTDTESNFINVANNILKTKIEVKELDI